MNPSYCSLSDLDSRWMNTLFFLFYFASLTYFLALSFSQDVCNFFNVSIHLFPTLLPIQVFVLETENHRNQDWMKDRTHQAMNRVDSGIDRYKSLVT